MENLQSAIRLSELGPRFTLQLMKVEDGLLDGEVLFHELVHKTDEEVAAIKKKRDEKRLLFMLSCVGFNIISFLQKIKGKSKETARVE